MPSDPERLQTVADALLEASAALEASERAVFPDTMRTHLRRSLRLVIMCVQLLAEDLRERGDS